MDWRRQFIFFQVIKGKSKTTILDNKQMWANKVMCFAPLNCLSCKSQLQSVVKCQHFSAAALKCVALQCPSQSSLSSNGRLSPSKGSDNLSSETERLVFIFNEAHLCSSWHVHITRDDGVQATDEVSKNIPSHRLSTCYQMVTCTVTSCWCSCIHCSGNCNGYTAYWSDLWLLACMLGLSVWSEQTHCIIYHNLPRVSVCLSEWECVCLRVHVWVCVSRSPGKPFAAAVEKGNKVIKQDEQTGR